MYRGWIKVQVPLHLLLILTLFALFSYLLLSYLTKEEKKEHYQEMVEASQLMKEAMDHLYQYRIGAGLPYEEDLDPNRTGLIGLEYTSLTTTIGPLTAKRTATNPSMAALSVDYFKRAGLREGDVVGIGASGSFPSLLLAVLSACRVLHIHPLIIYSMGSSTYGANIPGFSALEMLEELRESEILPYEVLAVSLGGVKDRGEGLLHKEEVKSWLEEGPYPLIYEKDLERSRSLRVETYREYSPEDRIHLYINIGGGSASLGTSPLSLSLDGGLLLKNPLLDDGDGLIFYYLEEGIPVIHILNIQQIAREEGLEVDPVPLPLPGEEGIYYQVFYPKPLVALLISILLTGTLSLGLYYGRRN